MIFSLSRILPWKNPIMWKGVGLGGTVTVFLLVFAVTPNFIRAKKVPSIRGDSDRMLTYLGGGGGGDRSKVYSGLNSDTFTVQADAPKIIRKAEMRLQVASCRETQKKIEALAITESGFLESSTLEEDSAEIKLRVPSKRFDAIRTNLRDMAVRVRQDTVSADDVSKQYIDHEARLRNLRAEEQQFLEIMKKAHSVPDVLAVTKELDQVRGEIESADADFRHLREQIDMSQISISLYSETSAAAHWAPGTTIKSAYTDLLQSLASLGDFIIWLVVNLPVLVLWTVTVLLLAAACWYVLRRVWRILRAMFGQKAAT